MSDCPVNRPWGRRPSCTVSPLKTNTRLDDLLAAVNNRFNAGGQGQIVTVAADGTISLTKIGKAGRIEFWKYCGA